MTKGKNIMQSNVSKKLITTILFASLLGSGFVISACTGVHQEESTGQYIDGSVLTTKIKTKLLADDYVKGLPITVKTYKNVVQLSGFVDNEMQERRAMEIARSVEGVVDVKDALIIKRY